MIKIYHRGKAQGFVSWYSPIAEAKNYPIIGRNAKTGELAPDKCGTTAYSKKIAHPENEDDYIWEFGDYKDESFPDLTKQEAIDAGFIQEQE